MVQYPILTMHSLASSSRLYDREPWQHSREKQIMSGSGISKTPHLQTQGLFLKAPGLVRGQKKALGRPINYHVFRGPFLPRLPYYRQAGRAQQTSQGQPARRSQV